MNDQHRALRLVTDNERREARQSRTLGQRLDRALVEARVLSEAATANLSRRVSGGLPTSEAPERNTGLLSERDNDSIADAYGRRLRLMIEALEREVDAHHLRPVDKPRESREERDARIVRDFPGLASHIVSFIDPSLGSPRSIERVRARAGLRPVDGREIR